MNKKIVLAILLQIGMGFQLEQLKNDFPDYEENEELQVFISTKRKTNYDKTAQYPTNVYNKFVEFDVKSFDLLEKESKDKNLQMKTYDREGFLYCLVVMFDNKKVQESNNSPLEKPLVKNDEISIDDFSEKV